MSVTAFTPASRSPLGPSVLPEGIELRPTSNEQDDGTNTTAGAVLAGPSPYRTLDFWRLAFGALFSLSLMATVPIVMGNTIETGEGFSNSMAKSPGRILISMGALGLQALLLRFLRLEVTPPPPGSPTEQVVNTLLEQARMGGLAFLSLVALTLGILDHKGLGGGAVALFPEITFLVLLVAGLVTSVRLLWEGTKGGVQGGFYLLRSVPHSMTCLISYGSASMLPTGVRGKVQDA